MAYTPYEWSNESFVNPSHMNNLEQGVQEALVGRFASFNLNGGSMTITNGFYLGIIQGNNVNYRTRMAFIRITGANTMIISYLTPTTTTAEFEFTLNDYVLSTNGQNNGNVCVIKLD